LLPMKGLLERKNALSDGVRTTQATNHAKPTIHRKPVTHRRGHPRIMAHPGNSCQAFDASTIFLA
jgi:hypothetical protein